MKSFLFLLGAAVLASMLPSCVVVKIDSPSGARIQPELKRGMPLSTARQAVARGGVITAETEHRFTAGRRPVVVSAMGAPAPPPDLSSLSAAKRARVAKSLTLTRFYGIFGLDDFVLLFDNTDRLLGSDLQSLN